MIIYLLIIFTFAVIQTTITPINFCLFAIIAIALLNTDQSSLFIAFFGGLILGLLTGTNLGFYCLLFILIAELVRLSKSSPVFGNNFFLIPLVLACLLIFKLTQQLLLKQSFDPLSLLSETFAFFVVYYLFKFFEDRFITHPDLKLKIR